MRVAVVTLAGTGVEVMVREGATVAIRNMNFLKYFLFFNFFHNSLQILFRNINNSFLTNIISLQAKFEIYI